MKMGVDAEMTTRVNPAGVVSQLCHVTSNTDSGLPLAEFTNSMLNVRLHTSVIVR
jgi:hypothetical protein